MREGVKDALARGVCAASPQCRFERAAFVLAHMRSGSTALSNVLCSRPEISGYGEAHVAYRRRSDLGRLVVNQARRGAWRPRARFLFDKILHSRHDAAAPPEFFRARAVFLVRRPEEAIPSIRRLFEGAPGVLYKTDEDAAAYYLERVCALAGLWRRFPPERRALIAHEALIADPEASLARVSRLLGLARPLENRYRPHAASARRGGGDPTRSARLDRIAGGGERAAPPPLAIDPALRERVAAAHARLLALGAEDASGDAAR